MTTPITTTLRALTADTETLLAARLRPLGVTVAQAEFLAVLAADPDACGADAARACHVTPQTGTSVLRGLTQRGLIKVQQVPGSGRRHTIAVTPAGHRTLAQARAATGDIDEQLAALLGPEAANRIQDATRVLREQVIAARPLAAPSAKRVRAKAATAKKAKRTTRTAAAATPR